MSVLQFIIQEGCSAVGKCFGLGDKQTEWCQAALLAVARVVHQELLVLLSMSLTGAITEVGKVWGGRLRPYFLLACNPDYSLFNCTDDLGNHLYISNVSVCQPENPQNVLEARKSWPSGHASSAFCGMVFAMVSHCWYRAAVGAHCHLLHLPFPSPLFPPLPLLPVGGIPPSSPAEVDCYSLLSNPCLLLVGLHCGSLSHQRLLPPPGGRDCGRHCWSCDLHLRGELSACKLNPRQSTDTSHSPSVLQFHVQGPRH